MVTIDTFRKLALSFPEATEEAHFEKTSFRVKKNIFATYDGVQNRACIKLSEIDQDVFSAADKTIVFPVDNKWGKQGWTLIELDKVHEDLFKDALSTAYCEVAPTKLSNQLNSLKVKAETDRFILRELLPSDVEGMFDLDSDPEVHNYLGNKPVTNREQVTNIINLVRQQYRDNGIGRWAIIDKKTNEFIGWTGLKLETKLTNNHQNYYDIGYRLRRKFWGQGIASETAMVSLDYAFNTLQVKEVFASAHIDNVGSNKILHKIGMNLIETFYYEDIKCNWYRLDSSEYEEKMALNLKKSS